VIKKPRTLGGNSPVTGLQNKNPQGGVAPVEKKILGKLCHELEMTTEEAIMSLNVRVTKERTRQRL